MSRELVDSGIEWLGKIPVDWNMIKAKYILSITTGKKDAISENSEGHYEFFTCSMENKKTDNYCFDQEALLVCGNGIVGFTRYFKGKFDAYQRTYVLGNFSKNVSPIYLKHYFNGLLRKKLEIDKVGSVIDFIKLGDLQNFNIVLPDFETQEKIASYLENKVSLIDETIENNKKEIELLDEYKVSFIDKEIFFEKTNNIKLKYLVKVRNEKGISKTSNEFISLENIESRTGNHIITETDYSNCSGKIFKKGDLLINKLRPYLAKSYLAEFDGVCTGEIEVISVFFGNINYLKYYTLSSKYIDLVNSSTYGTKMPRANWNFIKNMLIPNISIEKQTNVVNNINNINDKINQVIQYRKQIIEKLEEYKKSLIYEAVTGKIEV